jgi:carboxyl-terminal processing protease
MISWKRAVGISLLIFIAMAAAFASGYLFRDLQSVDSVDMALVDEAYQILKTHAYYDLPEPPNLQYNLIRGLVGSLNDPYTIFVEPAAHELESDELRGEFGGIGVRLDKNLDGDTLVYPIPESPAAAVGITDGNQLVSVDDLQIQPETSLQEIEAALRGPIGTQVSVQIVRQSGDSPEKYAIKRASFPLPSVTWNLDDDEPRLGVIQIARMAATTPDEVQKAVADLRSKGASLFVLDLRNNPGGLLDSGINTARLFLKEGEVIEQQYKNQPSTAEVVQQPGALADLPIVVIVNGGTASSAELLAGALQAHQRALVYGQQSYGKDTLQLVFELSDHSSLHVTAAKWWVPDLDPPIADHGIVPDVPVDPNTSQVKPEIQAIIQDYFSNP